LVVPELDGNWDAENAHFETGRLAGDSEKADYPLSLNPLKQAPPPYEIQFASNAFPAGKFLFKQSNQSREFVADRPSPSLYGNIMHHLFEQITGFDTIELAVDNLISNGLLRPDEKRDCVEKVHAAIRESKVESWFDGRYRIYREHSLITTENNEIVTKRPDRVLLTENETIVIDYKFGAAQVSHKKQVRQYMDLLSAMQYPHIKGFLWYVEAREVEEIN
jgi:ATP-dependent exoDNAse (exonuclease V) beta subunit